MEIESCPYCECDHSFTHREYYNYYYVQCNICNASGPSTENEEDAISEWNRISRKVRDHKPSPIEVWNSLTDKILGR